MFLDNKYTTLYYKIINNSKDVVKIRYDGKQVHHIIPRSLGGSDSKENLVVLTYKQHRLCHRLLIKMTTGEDQIKMSYAYSWFGKSAGTYKTGSANNFTKPEIIELVRARMKLDNPMKDPKQRQRMREKNNNPLTKPVTVDDILFDSVAAAATHFNTTCHVVNKALKENISALEAKNKYQRDTRLVVNGTLFNSKKAAISHFKSDWKQFHRMISDGTITITPVPES